MKRGCRPIGVSVIQQMMRHYLGKANLLTMKGDETGQFGRITPPHSLRHLAATIALKHGAPLDKVQPMLRHASIGTTMLYVHSDVNEERITEAAEHRISDFTKPC